MSLAADGLTPARCAQRAAALLESAESSPDRPTPELVEIADCWRRLGETMSENAAMVPWSSTAQGEGGSNP